MALGLPPDLQMLIMTQAAARRRSRSEAFEQCDAEQPDAVGDHRRRKRCAGWSMFPKISLGGSKILRSDLRRRLEPAARRAGLARGPARRTASSARPRRWLRRAAAVRADDAARPDLPAPAARSADETDVAAARRRCSRSRPTQALRVGRMRGDEPVTLDRRRRPPPGSRSPPGKRPQLRRARRRACRPAAAQAACLPSSILAIALRCTSSGPSAKRSVRAPA